MKTKRLSAFLLASALLLSSFGCQRVDPGEEQKKFNDFLNNEFIETMESDYTTSHVYLNKPENFGVSKENMEINLGTRMDMQEQKEEEKKTKETYEQFKKFKRNALTDTQQDIYDSIERSASLYEQMSDDKFDYYASAFESMGGLHYQLPTLFADWELRNEQDVKDLILLLEDVDDYVDSAIEYTKIQAEKGLLMLDLDSIISYCENIVKKGENSSILTSLYDSIDALHLSDTKTSDYKQQVKKAFAASFLPAYQNILDTMNTFKKQGVKNAKSLSAFENGKEYYKLLLQQSIGSDKTPKEVKKMMEDAFYAHISNIQDIVSNLSDDEELLKALSSNQFPQTSYTSYEQILEDIKKDMFQDFPEVKNLKYNIKDINEEIASDSGVAAYFNIPSIDGDSIKQLRVNPKSSDIKSLSTYSTVSHEGFPGHMYQYAYLYENIDNNFAKTLINENVYVEGYAVYAQYESFKYLDNMNQKLLQLFKENELASYCLVIGADIGIHYEGWDLTQFTDYMSEFGFALSKEEATPLYNQLWANPAAFQPYYVGYEEIIDLKENAQDKLGNKFKEKDFNTALLESGIAPFSVVERHIDSYIKRTK